MVFCLRAKSTAIALAVAGGWALSGWNDGRLSAEDKFIKQPVRAVPPHTPAEKPQPEPATHLQPSSTLGQPSTLVAPPGTAAGTRITNPKSAQPTSGLPSETAIPPESTPTALLPDSQTPTSEPLSLSGPTQELSLTDVPQVTVSSDKATVESNSHSQLRWLARGAMPASPSANNKGHSTGPLELINPSFSSERAEPKLPNVPTPATVSVPSRETAIAPLGSTALPTRTSETASATTSEEQASSKKVLASLVSSQIIAERPGNEANGRPIRPIDAPPGWQAIGEEMGQRIANCEALLNRKAYYSAREEGESAMLTLVRVLDLISNRYTSEPAWFAANKAMREAEDFSSAQRLTSDSDILRRIILSHETPVLKDADVTTLAPLAAAQHYRRYAEAKLLECAQGHPWAAEVVYAIGRTYQAQADVVDDGSDQPLRWKAVTLYRAARAISPYNAVATNQLGYVLLQMDRAADAREVLVASLSTSPSLQAYENLVEASRRLGDQATGNWAMQQALALKSTMVPQSNVPPVIEVDPRTFAALSPYTIGPNPQPVESAQQPYRTAAYPTSPNRNQ